MDNVGGATSPQFPCSFGLVITAVVPTPFFQVYREIRELHCIRILAMRMDQHRAISSVVLHENVTWYQSIKSRWNNFGSLLWQQGLIFYGLSWTFMPWVYPCYLEDNQGTRYQEQSFIHGDRSHPVTLTLLPAKGKLQAGDTRGKSDNGGEAFHSTCRRFQTIPFMVRPQTKITVLPC